MDTLPRPRASQEPIGYHRGMKTWAITWFLFDAQAACVFSCSASKRSSFFQSVNVMAAILRASVRRAISGFMPLASKPRRNPGTVPVPQLALVAVLLKISFISWLWF